MNFRNDETLTVFTAEGTLGQCENALKAASNGSLSVGARSDDGVVIASLKAFPKLVEREKVYKVDAVCDTIGITYAGITSDYRVIYMKACRIAEDYKEVYGRYPYVDVFVRKLSRYIQECTQSSYKRPFGILILVCGFIYDKESDKTIPLLYQLDPTGSFEECNVSGIGKEAKGAKKYIQNRTEGLDDNIVNCVAALRDFAGSNIDHKDVDVGVLKASTREFVVYNLNSVKEVFDSMGKK